MTNKMYFILYKYSVLFYLLHAQQRLLLTVIDNNAMTGLLSVRLRGKVATIVTGDPEKTRFKIKA